MKKALITGVGGQDGSFLAEHLLDLGYEVHGLTRGLTYENLNAIPKVRIHVADMRDEVALENAFRKVWPDELYNLAAQVFIPTSWTQPEETFDVNVGGLLRMLKIVQRLKPDTRVYQASSSEMYGNYNGALNEDSPMVPVSPYGCSKLAAHHLVRIYRESGLYVVGGILFNHECISANTPLITRRKDVIDILPAGELVSKNAIRDGRMCCLDFAGSGWEIWDGEDWQDILTVTFTNRNSKRRDHGLLSIEARGGSVEVTKHHNMISSSGKELRADQVERGDHLKLGSYPPASSVGAMLLEETAEFLGLLVAEGCAWNSGCQFTNSNERLVTMMENWWKKLFLGTARRRKYPSGFVNGADSWQLILSGGTAEIYGWLLRQIYTRDGLKRVPKMVLNGTKGVRQAFLQGYYAGDGLKGGQGNCSFKTNSSALAQGLCYLYSLDGRTPSVYSEHRDGHLYYQVNESSNKHIGKGSHLKKDQAEVRKIIELAPNLQLARRSIPRDWVVDIETSSGQFMAGVGRLVVHNSPRRGEHMVTRKITRHVAKWRTGQWVKLKLGNGDAQRDWGHARDYVKAMHLMLQQLKPTDYVIGTGQPRSVKVFLETAMLSAGLEPRDFSHLIEFDAPEFSRQNELYCLHADASKAKRELHWEPETSFGDMVTAMVDYDYYLEQNRLQVGTLKSAEVLQ